MKAGIADQAAELVLPADTSYLELVGHFVTFMAGRSGLPDRETARVRLAVDEACANAMLYGIGDESGGAVVRVVCEIGEGRLTFRIQDQGPLFSLEDVPVPDLEAPLERRVRGGLGLYLMRRVMDSVELRPHSTGKELVLVKVVCPEEGCDDGD